MSIDDDTAGRGLQNPRHHFDGGGFAGPVGPQKSELGPFFNFQGDVVNGLQIFVLLDDLLQLNHMHSLKFPAGVYP